MCPRRIWQLEPHLPTPLVPSYHPDHVGKQVSSLHLGISSNQGESPQRLSPRNSGYISGFPSGLDKADNTQENINTDLETHTVRVLVFDPDY